MKLSVPITKDGQILNHLRGGRRRHIQEVYIALPYTILPSARLFNESSSDMHRHRYTNWIKQAIEMGLDVNIVCNSPLLPDGRKTIDAIRAEMTQLKNGFDIQKITLSSFVLLESLNDFFRDLGIVVEVSVIDVINSIAKIDLLVKSYDSIRAICLNRKFIKDVNGIKKIKEQFPDLSLKIIPNDTCFIECVWEQQHYCDLMAGHGLATHYCINHISSRDDFNPLRECAFIRPEDIKFYEGSIDLFKIPGRNHTVKRVLSVIDAYINKSWKGNLLNILENNSQIVKNIDNTLFPDGYVRQMSTCRHRCLESGCSYCDSVYATVCGMEN